MPDATPPPSAEPPPGRGEMLAARGCQLIAILLLAGMVYGAVWAAPRVWEGRPKSWCGWTLLAGGLAWTLARAYHIYRNPPKPSGDGGSA